MVRSILAVIGGYVALAIGVGTVMALLELMMGGMPEDPSQPYDGPVSLLMLELIGSGLVAIGGGWVCGFIAKRQEFRHALVLAGLIAILGGVTVVVDAGLKPLWSTSLLPVVGVLGVLLGARLRQNARERAQLRAATG